MNRRLARPVILAALLVGAAVLLPYRSARVSATPKPAPQATNIAPMKFHHVHLLSTDPKAAADWYLRPFAKTATRTTFNGFEAVKTGNIYLLFTKVSKAPKSDVDDMQSSLWHFGWNTPDSQQYDHDFRAKGLKIAEMWDAQDGKLVDMSSDVLPGPPPTQEQIIAMRAQGLQPTHKGGFGYLRGPDNVMIENAQGQPGEPERFNHVHMLHEHPVCAMQWYAQHLGATVPPNYKLPAAGEDCKRPYSAPTFPSFHQFPGFVREPAGGVTFGDIGVFIRPWPGGGLASPEGYVVDHWALSVADLQPTADRLKSEGVKILEDVHAWGNSRTMMIEGPDRARIEIIEEK
jgi:Glyoxalase/Bleomycin resistance protein/Dioxygenase superfamily